MSYSIGAKGATKDAVREELAGKMAEVVATQPVHAADKDQALTAADAFLSLLPDTPPAGQEFNVSLSGSVCTGTDGLVSTGVNVYASLNVKPA